MRGVRGLVPWSLRGLSRCSSRRHHSRPPHRWSGTPMGNHSLPTDRWHRHRQRWRCCTNAPARDCVPCTRVLRGCAHRSSRNLLRLHRAGIARGIRYHLLQIVLRPVLLVLAPPRNRGTRPYPRPVLIRGDGGCVCGYSNPSALVWRSCSKPPWRLPGLRQPWIWSPRRRLLKSPIETSVSRVRNSLRCPWGHPSGMFLRLLRFLLLNGSRR
mmetsp:Transcript_40609/g.48744  ORF Transcript_40609/g.48744 Transcript_40609/m.48744 type:complete len:212 (+) Transcript_40609:744-1379(+)